MATVNVIDYCWLFYIYLHFYAAQYLILFRASFFLFITTNKLKPYHTNIFQIEFSDFMVFVNVFLLNVVM